MKNRTNALSYLAILFAFFVGMSCNNDKSKSADVSNEPPVPVTAVKLLADYEADKSSADKQYKGKTLIVSGEVLSAKTKQDGSAIVLINSEESSIGSIQCLFTSEQAANAAKLERNQQVSVKGTCEGMDDIGVSVLIVNSVVQ